MSHQRFEVEPGIELNIAIDDCTDPWSSAETILMVHGLAESGEAWRGWVPHLSRHYRVARIDLRGFGRSTPMPANHPWNMERLLDDLAAVIKYLGCKKVHLIGAKSGGSMVLTMAARKPELVQSVIAGRGETNGIRFLSEAGVERIFESQINAYDPVLGRVSHMGMGYGLSNDSMPIGPHACYWGGYGGSVIIMDLDADLTVAYMMNRMELGLSGDVRGATVAMAAAVAAAG